MNPQSHYPANRLWFQGESHSDLPQLPDHLQALWKAQKRPTALPLQSMQQDLHRRSHSPLDDMRLPLDRAVSCLQLLLEGMSIRSAERITGVHRDTILRLLVLAGERCQKLMDEKIKNLDVLDVEVDEIWGFVGKKEGHKLDREKQVEVIGDAYCFVGIEANCKLILCHHLGKRDQLSTDLFIRKLATGHFSHAVSIDLRWFQALPESRYGAVAGPGGLRSIGQGLCVSRGTGNSATAPPKWWMPFPHLLWADHAELESVPLIWKEPICRSEWECAE